MSKKTVMDTVESGLCCGCGVCKGICPKACINWKKKNGLYAPDINAQICVSCGICASVCPGLGHIYEPIGSALETVTGPVLACSNAWSKDVQLRHISASGGVVMTLIRSLLEKGEYEGAFCLDGYDYHQQLKTRLYAPEDIERDWSESEVPKSRYLPVSHEDAVLYMKQNKRARLIIVGTSCAVRGLQSAVKTLNLNREQYLFVGLFCDKVFNYNILPYFEKAYSGGVELKSLHFKNKESGGWPGDMKFFPEHGEPFYVPLDERVKAKDYFMPERCLYCVDKLNICADISLGDNYTGKDASDLGSNSVIIRTEAGKAAWNAVQMDLEVRQLGVADICKAQFLSGRLNNLYFGELKAKELDNKVALNQGVRVEENCGEYERAWHNSLKRLKCGALYPDTAKKLVQQMQKDKKNGKSPLDILIRTYYYLRRKIFS